LNRRSRFLAIFWCLGLLFFGAPLSAAEKKIDETRQNLKQIEQRLAKAAKSLSEKQKQEKELGSDLKTVEREQERLRERVASQNQRLEALKQEVAAAEQENARQKQSAEQVKEQVNQRLAALYKGGDLGLIRTFFNAESPVRMAEDYEFLGRIVRRDRELLAGYRQRLDELRASLGKLSALREEQEQLLADGRRDQESLKQAAQLKKQLLGKVQKDKSKLTTEIADLKERAARLSDLVKKLESAKPREYTSTPSAEDPASPLSSPFGQQKGRLPWPVAGKVKVPFGTGRHADLGTLYESHGIEIRVAQNHPVAAVWPGRVAFASEFKGYGNLLIVDHGASYYTLYAQASRLAKKVGESVRQGETVAFSGFEGNDAVYFEIRHRGTPLNPTAWLKPR